MFTRIAINYLRQWAEKEERKPLVLRGARQVGKTTLVDLFAKDFEYYIYINLEDIWRHREMDSGIRLSGKEAA